MTLKTLNQNFLTKLSNLKGRVLPVLAIAFLAIGSFGICANIFAADGVAVGSVVSIKLTDGTDYKFVISGENDGGNTMLMGLDNACAIAGVKCVNRDGLPSSTGTVYNASPLSYDNTLTGKEQSITNQTTNFYNLLPNTFKHETVTRSTNWGMRSVARSTNATTTAGDCSTGGANCVYSAPVFLASYEEWQGGLSGYIEEPANGSVGDVWCKARYGADDCKTTEIYKHYNFPWLRTADASTTERAWSLRGMSGYSVNLDLSFSEGGLLPAMYVNLSRVNTTGGDGSYGSPYMLAAAPLEDTDPGDNTNPGDGSEPAPDAPKTGVVQGLRNEGDGGASMMLSVVAVAMGLAAIVAMKISKVRRMKLAK